MLTTTSPEQPALGAQSPLTKALAKPTIDISPSTPLSRNSPTLQSLNRILSRTSRKVTPSTPSSTFSRAKYHTLGFHIINY